MKLHIQELLSVKNLRQVFLEWERLASFDRSRTKTCFNSIWNQLWDELFKNQLSHPSLIEVSFKLLSFLVRILDELSKLKQPDKILAKLVPKPALV